MKPFENDIIVKKGRKRSYRLDKLSCIDFIRLGIGTEKDYLGLTGKEKPKLTKKESLIIEAKILKIEGCEDLTIKELEEAIEEAGL